VTSSGKAVWLDIARMLEHVSGMVPFVARIVTESLVCMYIIAIDR
jgi:hypothetical protein